LRSRAKIHLAEKGLAGMGPADMERLVQELQVHRIELEMQNEELKKAQSEIAESREKYIDLYDFAPVGYFSFDRNGVITEANLTGASLIGIERSQVIRKPFSLFVSPQHRDIFSVHRRKTQKTGRTEKCELLIQRKDGSLVPVLIESVAAADRTGNVAIRCAVTDITEHKRMEEDLKRYELLARHGRDIILFVRRHDGRILEANEAALVAYGYRRDELLSLHIYDLRGPKGYSLTDAQMDEADSSGILFETEHLRKDGTTFPVEVSSRGTTIGGERVLLSAIRDITERKKTQEALLLSEERYRNLFESMHEGFALCEMIYDEAGSPVDFRYLDVNPAFALLTGLPEEQVKGRTVKEVIPDVEAFWIETYGRVVKTGRSERVDSPVVALGKHYEVYAWRSAIGRFGVVFTDITERKRAEIALHSAHDDLERRVRERTVDIRHTNKLLQLYAVQSSKKEYLDAVVKLLQEWTGCEALGIRALTREGDIPYESYVGFTKDFCQSENFLSIHRDQCVCIRVVAEGPEPQDMPYFTAKGSFHCDDTMAFLAGLSDETKGRFRGTCIAAGYASVTVIPISYRGKILGAIHLVDRKKAKVPRKVVEFIESVQPLIGEAMQRLHLEEEGEKLQQQLRQAQKMDALGTLTGGIAHDFNNMLAAIIGFTELVADHVAEGSPEALHLKRVLEASLRGRDLIRQMLTYARQNEQEKKPLRLSGIVTETVEFLRASTPSTISIRVNITSESAPILGDPTQVQQILMNLCTNAAYAMREKGGVLDINLSDFSVSASHGSDGMKPGLYMRLLVRDTGMGMPPDILDKIFDPFFTTKKLGEGSGLGLSVVHGIVTQHDGYITVESEPGKGSVFTVYFPKITEEPAADPISDDELPTGSERILFVDDEEALMEMGEDILAELGYEVTSRMNGREALALFKLDPSRFDLVITDQTMPEMTGVELVKEILALRPHMPIIMCTGFSYVIDADKARGAGIKAFALKPLTKREIAKTIRNVLDE
jgi:PAS domain S-box-containing protein